LRTNRSLSFSLIICTYKRAESLKRLLDSVNQQSLYPDEIIVVDGSPDDLTSLLLKSDPFKNLKYFKVNSSDRGLTKQRNYGIAQSAEVDIICFLDDDIVLLPDYFSGLIASYHQVNAIGIGGWIEDDTKWQKVATDFRPSKDTFVFDHYQRKLGMRHALRKRLHLEPDKPPGWMPDFSHGYSTGFLPPSGKIYEVEYFMGGVSSYRKELFQEITFSSYYQGYGLYEDMDFCLRASRLGKLYLHTGAKVLHLHEEAGRPNFYKYGKMVVINGFRVWRLKFPKPSAKAKGKWYIITLLLTFIRLINFLQGDKSGLEDFKGRVSGLINLFND